MTRTVDVVVLGYGEEPLLTACVEALLASRGVDLRIHLVDNGAHEAVSRLPRHPALNVLTPGENRGYAGGCNLGAAHGSADVLVFVNSDVVVEPDALRALAARLADPAVGLATGCLLLLPEGGPRAVDRATVNTVGNPVHWSGFSWCGGYGDPRSAHLAPTEVASVTGGLFAVRRDVWTALGGFDETFFAYHEDVDLSLRAWITGRAVVYEPAAVGWHDYAFGRNPRKAFLVERNRLLTMLTVPSARTWRRLAVPFLLVQMMAWARAAAAGDGLTWLRAAWWVARHASTVRRRRRAVQAIRSCGDEAWLALVERRLAPPAAVGVGVPNWVNIVLATLSRMAIPARAAT